MCKRDYARIAFLLFCCTAKTAKTAKYAQRGMSRTGLRLATATPALAALHLAHDTRVQSTLDTHAPRVHASPAMHMLSRGNTRSRQKLGCRARVTGHWLPVGRLAADTSGAQTALQTRSPSPLPATMRHPHAVHAIHHRRCHRTQRHDDNDRDEDERHDADDQEHDGRGQRVRATRARAAHAYRRTCKPAARPHEAAPRHSTHCSSDRHCARRTTR